MNINELTALSALILVRSFLIATVITVIFGPLWIAVVLGILLIVVNAHYECYAFRGFFKKKCERSAKTVSFISYNVNLAYRELSTQEKAEKNSRLPIGKRGRYSITSRI